MKHLIWILLTPSLLFANGLDNSGKNFFVLIEKIKVKNLNIDQIGALLKKEYCSTQLFKKFDFDCKLSNSFSKNLNASSVILTKEPIGLDDIDKRHITFIFGGYDKNPPMVSELLVEDYRKLCVGLKGKLTFQKEDFQEGGESPERRITEFRLNEGLNLRITSWIGGCFNWKLIIVSIFKSDNDNLRKT